MGSVKYGSGSTVSAFKFDEPLTKETLITEVTNHPWGDTSTTYYPMGIIISPINTSGGMVCFGYPWDMGIHGGQLKAPNRGWNKYGYCQDGTFALYNSGYYNGGYPHIGLALYTNVAADEDGFIELNYPITISLPLIDGSYEYNFTQWVVNSNQPSNGITVTDHTITITKFKPNEWFIRSNYNNTNTQEAFVAKFSNKKYILEGIDYNINYPVDPTTVEGFRVSMGNVEVHNKPKSFQNTFIDYGMATVSQYVEAYKNSYYVNYGATYTGLTSARDYYYCNGGDWTSKYSKLRYPYPVDLQQLIIDGFPVKFSGKQYDINENGFWNSLYNTMSQVEINDFCWGCRLFAGSNVPRMNLTFNPTHGTDNGTDIVIKTNAILDSCFDACTGLTSATLRRKGDTNVFNTLSNVFRGCNSLTSVTFSSITDAGAPSTQKWQVGQLSGTFEWCNSMKSWPSNIVISNTQFDSDYANDSVAQINFAFEGSGFESIGSAEEFKVGIAQQAFNQCSAVTINAVMDFRYVHPDVNYQVYNLFGDNTMIETISLKNINHNSWNFDGVTTDRTSQFIGDCSSFNQASVEYLFYNLYDLTSNALEQNILKRKNTVPQFNSWTAGGSGVSKSNTSATFSASNGTLTASNVSGKFFKFNVSNMASGEQLTVSDGTTTKTITSNGNYYIEITGTNCVLTANAINASHSVTVTYLTTWDGAVSDVTASTLYCPAAWDDQSNGRIIDNEMVRIATERGWMVYVGGVLKPYVPETTYRLEVSPASDNVGPVGSVNLTAIYKEIYDGETLIETAVTPTWSYTGTLPEGMTVTFNGNTMTVNNNSTTTLPLTVIGTYTGTAATVTGQTVITINPAEVRYDLSTALQGKTTPYVIESGETVQAVATLTEYRNTAYYTATTITPDSWTSSNTNAATINSNGSVHGTNTGTTRLTTTITAGHTIGDSVLSSNMSVTVKPGASVYQLILVPSKSNSESNPLSPKDSVSFTAYLVEYMDGVEKSSTEVTNQVDSWTYDALQFNPNNVNFNTTTKTLTFNNVDTVARTLRVNAIYNGKLGSSMVYISPADIRFELEVKEQHDIEIFNYNGTGKVYTILHEYVNDDLSASTEGYNKEWTIIEGTRYMKLNNSSYVYTGYSPTVNCNNTGDTDATVVVQAYLNNFYTNYTDVYGTIQFTVKGVQYTLAVSGATQAIGYHQTANFYPYYLGENGSVRRIDTTAVTWSLVDAQGKATVNNEGVVTNNNNTSAPINAQVKVTYNGDTATYPIILNQIMYEVYVDPISIHSLNPYGGSSAVTVTGVNQGWTYDNNGNTGITANPTTGGTGDTTVTVTWDSISGNSGRLIKFKGKVNTSTEAGLMITQGSNIVTLDVYYNDAYQSDHWTMGQSDTVQLVAMASIPRQNPSTGEWVIIEVDVTSATTWTISNTEFASVSSAGVVTGLQPGNATIYGYYGTGSDSATLTVTPQPTISISSNSANAQVVAGNTTITVTTTNQAWTAQVESGVDWLHVSPANGNVGSAQVLITWDANNTTEQREATITFRGTSNGVRVFTVIQASNNPYTYRLYVTPTGQTVNYGSTLQMTATLETLYNGSHYSYDDVTNTCTWTVDNTNIASITTNGGLLTNNNDSGKDDTITVKAKYGTRTASVEVDVKTNPNPSYTLRLVVEADTGTTQPISANGVIQVYAKVYQYMNGEYRPGGIDVSRDCDWVTSPGTYGSVGVNSGSFTGSNNTNSVQYETVTATYNPLNPHNTYSLEHGYESDSDTIAIGTGGTSYNLQVSSNGATVTYEADDETITVRGINQGWSASSDRTWLHVDTNSGNAGTNYSVTISWDEYTGTTGSRTGTVSFVGAQNNQVETYTITQNAIVYQYDLVVTADSYSLMSGETTDCYATYRKLMPDGVTVVETSDVTNSASWAIINGSTYGSINNSGKFTASNDGSTIQTVTVRATYNSYHDDIDINVAPYVVTEKYYLRAEAANTTVSYTGSTQCTLYVDKYMGEQLITSYTISQNDSEWSLTSGQYYGSITRAGYFTANNYSPVARTSTAHGQLSIGSQYYNLVESNSASVSINIQSQPSRTVTVNLATNYFENYTQDTEIGNINCTITIVDGDNQPVTTLQSTYNGTFIYGQGAEYPFDGTSSFVIDVPIGESITLSTSIYITFDDDNTGSGYSESGSAQDITISSNSSSGTIILPEIVFGTRV